MSYEYRLVFSDDFMARNVINVMKSSAAYISVNGECIYLREARAGREVSYDVSIMQENSYSIWMEICFPSPMLYQLLKTAINNGQYKCLEDGDEDDEVPLYKAFRLKHAP